MFSLLLMLGTSAANPGLTKLIDRCDPIAVSHGGCGNLDKPVWKRFESDTGEITKLDTASIEPAVPVGVIASIYTFSPGSNLDLNRLRRIHFTCRGQYEDLNSIGYLRDAPPRSVLGVVAATACAIGEPKRQALIQERRRLDSTASARASQPRPEDYCVGFSADACVRIQAGVDAISKPSFCRPGFGIAGSGLDAEQLRICYARGSKDDPN
ncbi:hypothetical protein [Sphingopyxis sp. R3-92]|uniref:hypothetical protein n=1 Tax=Sphingopyxis sp. R3-92 TaxID=3158553 RepID=UPI003EE77008